MRKTKMATAFPKTNIKRGGIHQNPSFYFQEVTTMRLGAILIAAGKHANPMLPSGEITVAQRMIASLQKAGVTLIAVVTGPDDKKMEKQLAQYGVFFLQNAQPEREDVSIALGLHYLAGKCAWIYLMDADRPLMDPDTLVDLIASGEERILPAFSGQPGQPILIKSSCAGCLAGVKNIAAVMDMPEFIHMNVQDAGVVLSGNEAALKETHIAEHERKLTRLVPEFTLYRGKTLLDTKLVALLRLIRETQSVRDACSRMQISYSTAWNLLNAAEDAFGYPLILRNKGGPSGSGSLLTEKGDCLLTACDRFEIAARENLETLYQEFLQNIL